MSGCPLWLENGESCCKTVLIPGARNEHGLAAASTVLESGSRMWGVGDEVEVGTGQCSLSSVVSTSETVTQGVRGLKGKTDQGEDAGTVPPNLSPNKISLFLFRFLSLSVSVVGTRVCLPFLPPSPPPHTHTLATPLLH